MKEFLAGKQYFESANQSIKYFYTTESGAKRRSSDFCFVQFDCNKEKSDWEIWESVKGGKLIAEFNSLSKEQFEKYLKMLAFV